MKTTRLALRFLLLAVLAASANAAGQEPTVDLCLGYLNSHPDAVAAYDELGMLYAKQNDLTNAERYFRKAVRIDRYYSRGYFNLGVLKLNTGDYNAAMENFILSVTFATDDIQGLVNIGNIYCIRNDLNNAFYYYQKAFQLNMRDADLQNNLGVVAIKQKKYGEAVEFLRRAWLSSGDEDIQLNLATAYYYLGETAKIRELFPVLNPQMRHYSTVMRILGQ